METKAQWNSRHKKFLSDPEYKPHHSIIKLPSGDLCVECTKGVLVEIDELDGYCPYCETTDVIAR